MRAVMVVVVAPCRNHAAGMALRREQVFVLAFFPLPFVEAFDQSVLHRLAGCDVVPADLTVFLPFQHRVRSQFRAVVADHHTGIATQFSDAIQFTGDTRTAN